MRMSYSGGFRKTEQAMSPLSWKYRDRSWASVPFDEKGEVYAEYCTETKNDDDEDVFFNKMTRRSYAMIFSQMKRAGGLDYVDRDVINDFVKDVSIEVAMRADPLVGLIFEELKPTEAEILEAIKEEREDVLYGQG